MMDPYEPILPLNSNVEESPIHYLPLFVVEMGELDQNLVYLVASASGLPIEVNL